MFARVELRVRDLVASRRFYATVLGVLPTPPTERDADGRGAAWRERRRAARPGREPRRAGVSSA